MSGLPVSLRPPPQLYPGDWPRLHPLGLNNNFLSSSDGSSRARESAGSGVERLQGTFWLHFPSFLGDAASQPCHVLY